MRSIETREAVCEPGTTSRSSYFQVSRGNTIEADYEDQLVRIWSPGGNVLVVPFANVQQMNPLEPMARPGQAAVKK